MLKHRLSYTQYQYQVVSPVDNILSNTPLLVSKTTTKEEDQKAISHLYTVLSSQQQTNGAFPVGTTIYLTKEPNHPNSTIRTTIACFTIIETGIDLNLDTIEFDPEY